MAGTRSLYDVLNVAPEAEPVVVEAAYKALIKKYHPDQAAEAPVSKDAAAINEAFAVLKDPAKRADYDHRLWSKQQAMRLAGLQAGVVPRRSRFAAAGGWIVAALLACALAAVAVGKSLAPPPLTSAAEAAEPHDSEEPARAAAARAAAAEAVHDGVVMPSSAAVIARVRAERKPRPAARSARSAEAAPARAVQARPARQRQSRAASPTPPEPRREKDFLERQGYIY
ncbi:MAG TPA: J domain-containing protein [Allosphingosinicella sp.]|nr:J domain-containing protein [Allosphingosinicella sp.]